MAANNHDKKQKPSNPLPLTVGFVAPSSPVPAAIFGAGIQRMKQSGFDVRVHPQCTKRHFFFAGDDEVRAEAFFEYAFAGDINILWCARGGYGAARILPLLDRLTAGSGVPPRKLLVGYSDAIALLEYVRNRWGWCSLHAPMPGIGDFGKMTAQEWAVMLGLIRQGGQAFAPRKVEFITKRPSHAVSARLVGGNLSVLASMAGTRFAVTAHSKILFIEDVGERLYKIDRMARQLAGVGILDGAKAIVLGTFEGCDDVVPHAPVVSGSCEKPKPLRAKIQQLAGLKEIFGSLASQLGIPVAYGLKTGHGSGMMALPLGADYTLGADGLLRLLDWDWTAG